MLLNRWRYKGSERLTFSILQMFRALTWYWAYKSCARHLLGTGHIKLKWTRNLYSRSSCLALRMVVWSSRNLAHNLANIENSMLKLHTIQAWESFAEAQETAGLGRMGRIWVKEAVKRRLRGQSEGKHSTLLHSESKCEGALTLHFK